MKTITRMQPLSDALRAQSEDYYLRVHTPFLRCRYRDLGVHVVYRTNLVLAQWDHLGGWAHPIDTWRFVQRDIEGVGADLSAGPENEQARRRIERDHLFFVSDMTMWAVDERVLWDGLHEQTSLAKYLFEIERGARTKAEAMSAIDRLSDVLRDLAEGFFGLRLILDNRVLHAAESASLERPGQTFTGRTVPTDTLSLVELYFDNAQWGHEALRSPRFIELMHSWGLECARGYHVLEDVGLDTR